MKPTPTLIKVVDDLKCPDLSFIYLFFLRKRRKELEMVAPVHTVGKSLMAKDSLFFYHETFHPNVLGVKESDLDKAIP